MSSDPMRDATRVAEVRGVPYVHRVDADIVLVLRTGADVRLQHWRCSTAAVAKAVERRVLDDLRNLPEHAHRILSVSVAYAEAALRFARLRARRELV
jgi:hypothetical protein